MTHCDAPILGEIKTKKRKGVPRRVALVKAVIIMATPRSKSLHGKGRKCIARNIYQVLESPLGDGAEFPTAMLTAMFISICSTVSARG